jgi:UPF0716 protein FxsA
VTGPAEPGPNRVHTTTPTSTGEPGPVIEGEVVEGEIVEPGQRR